MQIGELSRRSGVSRDTLRYYEKLGLLAPVGRSSSSGYKAYGSDALARLRQLPRLKAAGFTLREIQSLLDGGVARCDDLPALVSAKLARVEGQLRALRQVKALLTEVQQSCHGACGAVDGVPACLPAMAPCWQPSVWMVCAVIPRRRCSPTDRTLRGVRLNYGAIRGGASRSLGACMRSVWVRFCLTGIWIRSAASKARA